MTINYDTKYIKSQLVIKIRENAYLVTETGEKVQLRTPSRVLHAKCGDFLIYNLNLLDNTILDISEAIALGNNRLSCARKKFIHPGINSL
jgi:predicted metal-dependent hydrolase